MEDLGETGPVERPAPFAFIVADGKAPPASVRSVGGTIAVIPVCVGKAAIGPARRDRKLYRGRPRRVRPRRLGGRGPTATHEGRGHAGRRCRRVDFCGLTALRLGPWPQSFPNAARRAGRFQELTPRLLRLLAGVPRRLRREARPTLTAARSGSSRRFRLDDGRLACSSRRFTVRQTSAAPGALPPRESSVSP